MSDDVKDFLAIGLGVIFIPVGAFCLVLLTMKIVGWI